MADEPVAMNLRPLHYGIQPEQVEVRESIPVGTRSDGSAMTVDFYLPVTRTTKRIPIALLIHGPLPDFVSILPTKWRMFRDWGIALAQSGAAALMFNHRLGWPQHRIPATIHDIEVLMEWVRTSSVSEELDLSRLTAISYSGGALLVPELVRKYDSSRIRSYAFLYPLLGRDLDGSNSAEAAAKLRFLDVLPILVERSTPLLMFRSGADEVPHLLPVLDEAIAQALTLDARLELINLPGAPHGFDVSCADSTTVRAVERTIHFVLRG